MILLLVVLQIQKYDLGVQTMTLDKKNDDRGHVVEIFREDWKEFFGKDLPTQINFSESNPGVVRAWHRHNRNQIDYFLVQKGKVRICIYDGNKNSGSFGKLVEIEVDGNEPKIVKVPGHFWHGTKNVGTEISETIYFLTNLYDYNNPDEERITYDDVTIIDPKTQKPYDWMAIN